MMTREAKLKEVRERIEAQYLDHLAYTLYNIGAIVDELDAIGFDLEPDEIDIGLLMDVVEKHLKP